MKKRIALVNQRYGAEVNGGSEYYTRQLAEHLVSLYDVEGTDDKSAGLYHMGKLLSEGCGGYP